MISVCCKLWLLLRNGVFVCPGICSIDVTLLLTSQQALDVEVRKREVTSLSFLFLSWCSAIVHLLMFCFGPTFPHLLIHQMQRRRINIDKEVKCDHCRSETGSGVCFIASNDYLLYVCTILSPVVTRPQGYPTNRAFGDLHASHWNFVSNE